MPNFNGVWSLTTFLQYRDDVPRFVDERALFAGGNTGSRSNIIDYINLKSTGNATDFGDASTTQGNTVKATSDSHGGLS